MHDEPKSMLRYVGIALIVVVPLLYFISSHVDRKVAPVSAYVAQTLGVQPRDRQVAEVEQSAVSR